jgi:hypothetical protein
MFRRARAVGATGLLAYTVQAGTRVMLESMNGSRSEQLRARANHCRALAATFRIENNRHKMLLLAEDFERMASEVEAREVSDLSRL